MLAIAFLAVCSIAESSLAGPEFVDPAERVSPSGQYSLSMDPSEPFGMGPAKYSLRLRGEPQWTAELPFTLHQLAVTDAGYSVGHGFAGRDWIRSEFVVAILDPKGEVLLDERTKCHFSRAVHGHTNPHPFGLIVDEERDRFAIRLAHEEQFRGQETWWRYAITTARRLESIEPRAPVEGDSDQRFFVTSARQLHGTDLHLLSWSSSDWSSFKSGGGIRYGTAFTLMRPDGSVAWQLRLPADCETGDQDKDEALREHVRDFGAILEVDRQRRFTLWFARDAHAVRFEAKPVHGSEGAWEVHELDRRPHAIALEKPRVEFPELELVPLSTQWLASEQLGESSAIGAAGREPTVTPLGSPGWCKIVGGRLAVQDKRTAALYVWNEHGVLELYGRAGFGDTRDLNSVARIKAAPDGSWWVETDGKRGYLGWDAAGARLGHRDFGKHPCFASEFVWSWGEHLGLTKRDLAGASLETISRRPDNRWIQYVLDTTCLDDGSIAVLGYDDVLLYSSEGEPREVLPLPRRARKLDASGDWMLVSGWTRGAALRALSNGATYAIGSAGTPEHEASAFGLSQDGKRLLTAHRVGTSYELRRFALP